MVVVCVCVCVCFPGWQLTMINLKKFWVNLRTFGNGLLVVKGDSNIDFAHIDISRTSELLHFSSQSLTRILFSTLSSPLTSVNGLACSWVDHFCCCRKIKLLCTKSVDFCHVVSCGNDYLITNFVLLLLNLAHRLLHLSLRLFFFSVQIPTLLYSLTKLLSDIVRELSMSCYQTWTWNITLFLPKVSSMASFAFWY